VSADDLRLLWALDEVEWAITEAEEVGGNLMDVFNMLTQRLLLDGAPSELVQPIMTAGDRVTEWYRDREESSNE
jgi:hypothetical protein